ncbi:T9SS type A sorting domain-containing protein [Winogradskyella sp.]|uniref:T9SS type A sorting domain-containing protein n=1 Tax=Winogradskyella sp. TaxID=1883156 RepID=UPI003BAA3954
MKIKQQSRPYMLFILLLGHLGFAQNYNFDLVQNSTYNFTVSAVAQFDSGGFAPITQSYGFTLVVPDGITITVDTVLPTGTTENINLIPGDTPFVVGIDPTMADKELYLITTDTQGRTISAHANGAVIPLVTLTVNGAPTSGEIRILDNNSTLANGLGVALDTFFQVDVVDDSTVSFNNEFNVLGSTPAVSFAMSTTYSYNNGWSPSDPNGVATASDDINIVAGNATISTDTNCDDISVAAGAGLTINNGITLTTASGMVLASTSTAYSSLILNGTVTGTITYQRHVNSAATGGQATGGNDLISPPLPGQTFGAFRAANANILSGNIAGNPAFLFGPFNNTSGVYENYSSFNDANILTAGVGYRTGSTDNGTFSFTGAAQNGNIDVAVDNTATNPWHLIGNPYPSYLRVQDFLNEALNAGLINENAVGIYGYDGSATDGWTIYNLATTDGTTAIAPGQGFFILAEAAGNIRFTPVMRTAGTTDDFIAGRTANNGLKYMELKLQSTSDSRTADFYFGDNISLGLDPGYDAEVFGPGDHSLSLYSHLVDNDQGIDFAIQALPMDILSNGTVPLGIHANMGEQLTLSLSEADLPDGTEVYLLDSQENTSTHLNTMDFTITPIEDLNGTGRFYINFSQQALGLPENDLSTLQVFTLDDTVVIRGEIHEQTKATLYDMNGRLVLTKTFEPRSHNNAISTAGLSAGVYMVRLHNVQGQYIKKLIID